MKRAFVILIIFTLLGSLLSPISVSANIPNLPPIDPDRINWDGEEPFKLNDRVKDRNITYKTQARTRPPPQAGGGIGLVMNLVTAALFATEAGQSVYNDFANFVEEMDYALLQHANALEQSVKDEINNAYNYAVANRTPFIEISADSYNKVRSAVESALREANVTTEYRYFDGDPIQVKHFEFPFRPHYHTVVQTVYYIGHLQYITLNNNTRHSLHYHLLAYGSGAGGNSNTYQIVADYRTVHIPSGEVWDNGNTYLDSTLTLYLEPDGSHNRNRLSRSEYSLNYAVQSAYNNLVYRRNFADQNANQTLLEYYDNTWGIFDGQVHMPTIDPVEVPFPRIPIPHIDYPIDDEVSVPAIVEIEGEDGQFWEVPYDNPIFDPNLPESEENPRIITIYNPIYNPNNPPSPAPDPIPTHIPQSQPQPNPNPTPPPSGGPGTPWEDPDPDDHRDNFQLVTTKFPFSLPWDIYYLINLLLAEPITPELDVDQGLLPNAVGDPHFRMKFDVSLEFLDPYMPFFRSFILIAYAWFLVLQTRTLMGGGQ